MSGTRPYSPGFGRNFSSLDGGSAMQRQPEPSDGKPKIPDAGNRKFNSPSHPSKRGKTRFRDDRSRKYHHGTNSGRYNVKKHDTSLNRCDPFGLRKDSPVKQYQSHSSKKDKVKTCLNIVDNNKCQDESIKQLQNVEKNDILPMAFDDSPNEIVDNAIGAQTIEIEKNPLINGNVNAHNGVGEIVGSSKCQNFIEHTQVRNFQPDTEMKMIAANEPLGSNVEKKVSALNADVNNISDLAECSFEVDINMDELYDTMREFLQVESKFQPRLYLPVKPQRGEIAAGTRDGAVHVLRCLKVWYDVPTDVLFHAINLLDRFLTKMKVRLCHISCISVSCMHIAMLSHRPQLPPINTEDLVSISQCKCTAGDVRRMSAIIEQKLGAVGEAISPLHWLRLLLKLLRWAAVHHLGIPLAFFNNLLSEAEMINRLEILSCDASCCNIRACELALVLLCTHLDSHLTVLQRNAIGVNQPPELHYLLRIVEFAMELQRICQIGDDSFYSSHQAVVCVLERYNTRQKTPHRQCLVWKVSSRTLKILRPTDRLTSMLPTIQEQQYTSGSGQQALSSRSRSGSECSDDLNEDTKDWPTSPVVPILCNNN